MRAFAQLFDVLDRTTSTNAKVLALAEYLRRVPADDAAWALFFLTGRRLKRLLPSRLLHEWTLACTQLPEWLVEESYGSVGDYAETIALLLESNIERRQSWTALASADAAPMQGGLFDEPVAVDTSLAGVGLATWNERRLLPLRDQ